VLYYNITFRQRLKKVTPDSDDYEEYYLLECDAMWSGKSLLTFQRNAMPPSSGYREIGARSKQGKTVLFVY
jgi:hypothetical protein